MIYDKTGIDLGVITDMDSLVRSVAEMFNQSGSMVN